jgi:Tfp pilus assembly protein PilP
MKKYYRNSLFLPALLVAVASSAAFAQERDPFSPTGGSMMSKVKDFMVGEEKPADFDSSSPLTSTHLSGYKIVGVIVAEDKKVVSVKALNGISYSLKVGDYLGTEGGKISDITITDITVQTPTQEIKLPVNNKIEVPVANAPEKRN